jgi:hypothetical protein
MRRNGLVFNKQTVHSALMLISISCVYSVKRGAALGVGELGHRPGPRALAPWRGASKAENGKVWNNSISRPSTLKAEYEVHECETIRDRISQN